MNCPDRPELELCFEEALDEARAGEIRAHAASCEACGAVLRRLEEEAESLRRNLPEVPEPAGLAARLVPAVPAFNPWKPFALAASLMVVFLTGTIVWLGWRASSEKAEALRNAEAQVRYHLAQGEPAKAAAVAAGVPDAALRLEVARAAGPEEAVKLLDPLELSGMDRADSEAVAGARFEAWRSLMDTKVLRDGAVPAPFELHPYRMDKTQLLPREEMSRIAQRVLECAAERRDLARRYGGTVDAGLARMESTAAVLRYALGEIALGEVKPADDEVRWRLGDLLYRERQFDRAIEAWRPVLGDPRVIRRVAELAALRKHAPKDLYVWDYEVEKLLGRDPKIEAEAAAAVESLLRQSRHELPLDIVARKGIPKDESAIMTEEPVIFFPEDIREERWVATDPEQIFLLTSHASFRLETAAQRPTTSRAGTQMKLHSAYRGPIRLRLYRVKDMELLKTLAAENLVAKRSELLPVTEWETQFAPLWETSMDVKDWTFEVPHKGPGLFVLLADARYCPVYAVEKFIVTDAALVQQVASDRVLLFAADRVSGAPIPDLPLEGEVTGTYVVRPEDLLPSDDSNAAEYRRGFEAARAGRALEPDPTASFRKGHERALDLRALNPDLKTAFRGKTGPDGLFDWTVEPAWKPGYQYAVKTVTAHPETYSRVESRYSLDTKARALRAVVTADRPLYRPGDEVSFKAYMRELDGEGLRPYEGREVLVEFGTEGRVVAARSLPVTEFGTASGSFEIPSGAALGHYWARVNNGPSRHVFKAEEFRKPEFEIVLRHPAEVRAGQPVEAEILVRTYGGDPMPGAKVQVTLQAAPSGPAILQADPSTSWYFPETSRSSGESWTTLESPELVTDERGRALYRFQTDPGVARRYGIKAMAQDATRAWVERFSALEAKSQAVGVLVETDRPVYHPGETARLHVLAPGIVAVRIEERNGGDKAFTTALALQEGRGSCEYVVPESSRDLQVGVRTGDEWAWTPVPLNLVPRGKAEAALSLRIDRAYYRVGETAKLEIRSQDPSAHVLLVVVTGKIHQRRMVKLANGVAEVPLEIRDEDVPNVGVKLLSLHGDVLFRAEVQIFVPPVDRFLTVEVETDRQEYGPGAECRAVVKVTDSRGRPVPGCEIALGVVDEAIYALTEDPTPDLREYFHRYTRNVTVNEAFFFKEDLKPFIVWKAPTFVKGARNLYDAMSVGGGSGRYGGRFGGRENLVARGGGSRATSQTLRSDFRETAYWNAHLKTGADGTALATFRFPESLTSFRFTARGITRDHKVGAVKQNAVVRKDFYARLSVPRVLQEGNTVELTGLVHNYTKAAQSVKLSFKSPYPVTRPAPGRVQVAVGEVARVAVEISVDRFREEAAFEFAAAADAGPQDGLVIKVPGRRRGAPFFEGRAGAVSAGNPREEVFRVPEGAIQETVTLKLDLDAGLHSAIVEGLEPLIQYPYGCVEQTMSRFLPAVVARRALGEGPNRWGEKLPAIVASGLGRLYGFQNPDGSWGWWQRDGTNDAMTAYVLYGFAVCRKSGTGVDRAAADRAAKVLGERLLQDLQHGESKLVGRVAMAPGMSMRVFATLALAEYEGAWGIRTLGTRRIASTLANRSESIRPDEIAALALACARLGLNEEADRLAERLKGHAFQDVPTAALVLMLRSERGGDVGDPVRFLLSRRVGKGWRTTMDSAYAILGLSSVLAQAAPGTYEAPGRLEVAVNGVKVREVQLPGRVDPAFDGRISVPEPPAGWGGRVVVRLTFEGRGTAFYTASLEGLTGERKPEPVSRGIRIEREYFQTSPQGLVPVRGALVAGRPAVVHLSVTTPDAREYLMITDPRPDGFEPAPGPGDWDAAGKRDVQVGLSDEVDLAKGWEERLEAFRRTVRGDTAKESAWAVALLREILAERRFKPEVREEVFRLPGQTLPTAIEHRDDRTILFLGNLPTGTTHFYYEVRPEFVGAFAALPPRVVPMYEPEVNASGRVDELKVTEISTDAPSQELPPGVAGLKDVVAALTKADADQVMGLVAARPKIQDLLAQVVDGPALKAWLSHEAALGVAGTDVAERIAAARQDLRVRALLVESARQGPREWLPALEEAMGSDRMLKRVFEGAEIGDVNALDRVLAWVVEDRAFRLGLLAEAQRIRGTGEVAGGAFRPVKVREVLAALGPKAPEGDALVRWKLSQGEKVSECTVLEFVAWLERDLDLRVKVLGGGDVKTGTMEGTVSSMLDLMLVPKDLYYRVRDGALWIGPLQEIMK